MINQFAFCAVAIFVALDIVGALPMYLGMTSRMSREDRSRVTDVSMFVAFLVAVVFAFLGRHVFNYLGISFSDFRIAGGLVLLLISLSDLVGASEASTRATGSTGVVPLAVPLITGPAVLTTLVLQVNNLGFSIPLAALFANYLIAWFLLKKSDQISGLIGKDGMVVISKIAALLLAAISVAMIRGGVFEAISAFKAA
ncbi:MAG: MarC family protein [Oligoflexia bacterium]|nr:MarC family protein [Oligoflexia bacterium]